MEQEQDSPEGARWSRRDVATTVADLVAVGLVVAGVALVWVPAALVVAGLLLGAASWRAAA